MPAAQLSRRGNRLVRPRRAADLAVLDPRAASNPMTVADRHPPARGLSQVVASGILGMGGQRLTAARSGHVGAPA